MLGGVVETNAANWEELVVQSNELVVVEFWHEQCPYCRVLEPVYVELAKKYAGKLKFAKFNVYESPENEKIAGMYGIMGTPTLKFFCQGRPVQDVVGMLSRDYLEQAIDFAIQKHSECAEKSTALKLPYIS